MKKNFSLFLSKIRHRQANVWFTILAKTLTTSTAAPPISIPNGDSRQFTIAATNRDGIGYPLSCSPANTTAISIEVPGHCVARKNQQCNTTFNLDGVTYNSTSQSNTSTDDNADTHSAYQTRFIDGSILNLRLG